VKKLTADSKFAIRVRLTPENRKMLVKELAKGATTVDVVNKALSQYFAPAKESDKIEEKLNQIIELLEGKLCCE